MDSPHHLFGQSDSLNIQSSQLQSEKSVDDAGGAGEHQSH